MKNDLRFKSFKIEKFEKSDGGLTIEGYAAVFGNIDSYSDVINKGAFTKTLQERKDRIAFCSQHDITNPIGKILEIKEDDNGLWLQVKLSQAEQDIQCKIEEGILTEMSIGYREINCAPGTVDGKQVSFVNEVMLYEVSLVTIAANPMAVITGMKNEDLLKLKARIEALIQPEPDESTPKVKPLTKSEILNFLN